MGTKRLKIVYLLWVIALHCSNAQDSNSIQFPTSGSTPPLTTRTENRFPIPEVTQDVNYKAFVADMLSADVMNFAHDLGVVLDENEFPNTQIFSPLSIMSALSLLEMGANGNTYNQLNKLFAMSLGASVESQSVHQEFGWMLQDVMSNENNLKRPREPVAWRQTPANPSAFGKGGKKTPNDHIVRVANGLFIQQGFSLRPDYQNAAQSVYKSEVTTLDFKNQKDRSKHYINSWVNQNTLGKIPAIITDEVDSETSMVIASALYFKGFWEQPFLGTGTAQSNFYPDGRAEPPVRIMMMGSGGVFPYYNSPEYDCQIIGLPYKGNQTTMYIIQPHESTRRKLYDLQHLLTGDKINYLISKMEQKTAVLAFPKFHVTNTLNLKNPLVRLGIEDVFRNGVSDLSLIADEGVYASQPAASRPVQSQALPGSFSPTVASPQPSFQQQIPLGDVPASRPVQSRPPPLPVPASTWPPQEIQPGQTWQSVSNQQTLQPRPVSSNNRHIRDMESEILDRYNEPALILRVGSENDTLLPGQTVPAQWTKQDDLMVGRVQLSRSKRTVTYKVESEFMRSNLPLRLKDLILSKRITKPNAGKKLSRSRRQAPYDPLQSLFNLDQLRAHGGLRKPRLYADDILHKVDFEVNEQGTEAAAATLTYLRRSGTDVAFRCDAPFMILIRHDPTKLPLFYGKVNIPLA